MAGGLDWKPMNEFNGEPGVQYLFRVEWHDTYYDNGASVTTISYHYDTGEWHDTGYGAEVTGMGNTYDLDKDTGQYVCESGMWMRYTLTHFAVINEPEV